MGVSEKLLWKFLRKKTLNFRFRRQYALGPYILDFYCPEVKVCVEVDGQIHRKKQDSKRDAFLANLGIRTIRIPSIELFSNLEGALDEICRVCQEQHGLKFMKPPP